MKRNKKIATKLITALAMFVVLSVLVVNSSEMGRDLILGRRMEVDPPIVVEPEPVAANESIHQEIQAPIEPEVPEAPVLSELEIRIAHYESLVEAAGNSENFQRLASVYREAGMVRMQRDALERSYRLNNDQVAFEQLQSIVVNVVEENTTVQEKMWGLRDALRIEANQSNAINMLSNDIWFALMMPNMLDGQRNYYLEDPDNFSILYVEIGYDATNNNLPYTRAWYYTPESNEIVSVFQIGNMVQLLHSGFVGNAFHGDFSLWTCVVNGDLIHHDTGTFENGRLVGDFASNIYSISEQTDLVSLFNSRHYVEYLTFLGNFDENGETTVEQPSRIGNSQIAFALTEDGSSFLYHAMSDDEEAAEGFVFDYAFLGLSTLPEIDFYTPIIAEESQHYIELDLSQVQIRIFDSVIQWFDGERWHDMGSVLEFLEQDPLLSNFISIRSASELAGIAETSESGGIISPWIQRGVSSVPQQPTTTGNQNRPPTPRPPQQPQQPQQPPPPPPQLPPEEQLPDPEPPPQIGEDGQDIDGEGLWTTPEL